MEAGELLRQQNMFTHSFVKTYTHKNTHTECSPCQRLKRSGNMSFLWIIYLSSYTVTHTHTHTLMVSWIFNNKLEPNSSLSLSAHLCLSASGLFFSHHLYLPLHRDALGEYDCVCVCVCVFQCDKHPCFQQQTA